MSAFLKLHSENFCLIYYWMSLLKLYSREMISPIQFSMFKGLRNLKLTVPSKLWTVYFEFHQNLRNERMRLWKNPGSVSLLFVLVTCTCRTSRSSLSYNVIVLFHFGVTCGHTSGLFVWRSITMIPFERMALTESITCYAGDYSCLFNSIECIGSRTGACINSFLVERVNI